MRKRTPDTFRDLDRLLADASRGTLNAIEDLFQGKPLPTLERHRGK